MDCFKKKIIFVTGSLVLLISSCAPTEDEVITADNIVREGSPGVFLDSAVMGVDYSTSSGLGGTTDSGGTFYYNPGDQVSFTIGGISLGSVIGAAKLTPVEVMGASGTADQKVVNLSRLLQTLDADGDPSNGISISDSTKTTLATKSVNFDVSVDAFDNATLAVTSAVGKTMISAATALAHLHTTMKQQGLDSKIDNDTALKNLGSILDNFTTTEPGFTVTLSDNATTLAESGSTDNFSVVLTSAPTGNVVFDLVSSDTTEASVYPSTLTFGKDNWSVSREVTVTGLDDAISDGTISGAITVAINQDETKDSGYDALASHSVVTTISDNDATPTVTLTSSDVSVAENLGAATLTATLSLGAGSATTVSLNISGNATLNTDYSVSSTSIIIPAGSTSGTAAATAIADQVDEESETITVDVSGVSGGNGASESGNQQVSITITDDDTAAFTVTQSSGSTSVAESGSSDDFTVVLGSEPTGNVIFDLSASDSTEATLSASTLTFTSLNWNSAQTVTVTGVNDNVSDDNVTSTITVAINQGSTNDAKYDALSSQSVSVTTTDGVDAATFTIAETDNATLVSESGGTDTFSVVLGSEPTGNVVFSLTAGDGTEVSLSASVLTFSTSNWSTAQTVTVTGVNDNVSDDNVTSTITVAINQSNTADTKYDALSSQSVTVSTTDDDTAAFTVTESGGSTVVAESGSTDAIVVTLSSEPTGNVVLSLTNSDNETSLSASTLTFTPSNWNSAQDVTITGVDDNIDDDNVTSTITVAINQSSTADTKYDALDNKSVSVTTTDNDSVPTLTLAASSLNLAESGGTVTLTVTMSAAATADTTVALYTSGTGVLSTDYSISSTTLTIAAGSTSGTVTLTGIADQTDEDSETIIVDISGVSGGNGASESGIQQLVVSIIDDDTAAFTIAESSGSTSVAESGGTDTLTIVLGSQPTGDVVLSLSASDSSEASVYPSSLGFGTDNWSTAQTVTITGVADTISDGSIGSTLTVAINTSSTADTKYDALSSQSVSITTNDDEASPLVTLTASSSSVAENGGTSTLTATQNVVTASNTTVNLNTSGNATLNADYSISSSTITISAGSTSGTATLTAITDQLDDDGEAIVVDISSVSGANSVAENGTQQTTVTIADDDNASFTVTQTSGSTIVDESGSADNFTVVLGSQPTGNVAFSLGASDSSEVSISPSTLTFTSSNWNNAQTVTVTGVSDNLDDDSVTSTVTVAINTGNTADTNYDALSSQSVSVTTSDSDTASFTIVQTNNSTSVAESGSTDTFTVVLGSQPTDDVVFSVMAGDSSEATVSPSTLSFTSSNWNTTQTVTVTGVNDDVDDGSVNSTIAVAINTASTGDSKYDLLSSQSVTVSTSDGDTSAFSIAETGGSTAVSESGSTDTFTVVLGSEPTGNVAFSLSDNDSDDSEISLSSSTLTFTSSNWNTAQTVTVTGVNDNVSDDNVTSTITVAINQSSTADTKYDTLNNRSVTVTTTDNDTAAFAVTESGSSTVVSESGSTDTFTVVLGSEPTGNVVFSLTNSDNETTLSASTLTFTPSDWNSAQTVTITGVDDNIDDDNVTSTITVAINTNNTLDAKYDMLDNQSVTVTTTDND